MTIFCAKCRLPIDRKDEMPVLDRSQYFHQACWALKGGLRCAITRFVSVRMTAVSSSPSGLPGGRVAHFARNPGRSHHRRN